MKSGHSHDDAKIKKGIKGSFFSRHRSAFTFLAAFFCCSAVFGAAAAMLLFTKAGYSSDSSNAFAGSSSHVSYPASDTFNMLICVYSESAGNPVEFILYRLDTAKNKTVVMPVPPDLAVSYKNTVCSLSGVYQSGGIYDVADTLKKLLSIKIDFTCSFGSGSFLKIFNELGGLYGTVPEKLSFMMPDGSGKITLTPSPKQYLSGNKLFALVASSSYSGGDTARFKEQSSIMKEFAVEKLTEYYLHDTYTYYGDIFNYVSTDFSMNDLINRADAIIALSAENSIESPLPSLSSAGSGLLKFSSIDKLKGYFK